MGKGFNPFDLNRDGKVDWQDAYLYDTLFEDEDDNKPRRNVRWTSKDTETLSSCLGAILGGIIVIWFALNVL